MILLVVDTQELITNESLYEFEKFESTVSTLIETARKNDIEVVYVRHDDGPGSQLTKGTDGFEIYEKFKPKDNEMIFDKEVNSAFRNTGLLKYLTFQGTCEIIVVGLYTEYCIDATVKCGFEHGFQMVVPECSNTTTDNSYLSAKQSYEYYNRSIWKNRYARCVSLNDTIKMMEQFNLMQQY